MANKPTLGAIHYLCIHRIKTKCGADLRDTFKRTAWNYTHSQIDGQMFLQINQQPWVLLCEQIIEEYKP